MAFWQAAVASTCPGSSVLLFMQFFTLVPPLWACGSATCAPASILDTIWGRHRSVNGLSLLHAGIVVTRVVACDAQGSGGSNFNGWWVLVVVNTALAAWAGATPHLVGTGCEQGYI